MYIDKSTEIKIRNRTTGEIKTAYQGHKPWLIVDEKGNEIMADWEVYEEVSVFKSITAVSSLFLIAGFIYWICFSESFYLSVVGFCDACR
jgi:hypothetical protein